VTSNARHARSLGSAVFFLVGGLALLAASCRSEPASETGGSRYELRGRVVSVDADSHRLTVSHEDIPGFMAAMTMPFTVNDDWVFQAIAVGDEIEATLVVTEKASWLEDVVISRKGAGGQAGGEIPTIPGEPTPGDPVPDFALVNQNGQPIHLAQYRGKAVLLTFIYTRCPLPEYCPRMTSHFARLEKRLRERPALYDKTHLLTVSFDPAHDTPDVLRAYADVQAPDHRGFGHWELATGSEEQIRAITEFFGLTYLPERDQFVHSLRTAMIDPEGALFKLYRGNEWEPGDVLEDLESMELE
jgi:protein SCO1/2